MALYKILSKLPAGFLTFLLLGIGSAVYFLLPIRTLPALPADTYVIEISSPGLTPEEFDKLIASDLEQGLMILPCRKHLMSSVQSSFAQFRFVIKEGCQESLEALKTRISETIDAKKVNWPSYTEIVQNQFIDQQEQWQYLIEGADVNDPQIRAWLKKLATAMRTVEEVKAVDISMTEPQANIELDLVAMKRLGIDATIIADIIRNHLRDSVVGASTKSGKNFQFTFRSPLHTDIQGLNNLVLRTEPQRVTLKDIASVKIEQTYEDVQTFYNGKPGVYLFVTEQDRADVTKLKAGIAKVLDESIKNAPYPVSYKLLLDQSRFMTDQVQSIGNNAVVGVVSMLIFLGLVMGFRSAFAQLFSTPVIVASTLIVMYLTGQSINLISIMGMFIVLGIMVDDSVIVSDTYRQWRRKGYAPAEATTKVARSLFIPLIITFVAVSVSFLPVFFWTSSLSHLMKPIAIIFIAALGLSLVECLTLLPAHLQKLDQEYKPDPDLRERMWSKLEQAYLSFLKQFLRLRWIFVPMFLIATIGGAFFAVQKLKFVDNLGNVGQRLNFNYQLAEASHEDISSILKDIPGTVMVSTHRRGIAKLDDKELYGKAYGKITLVIVAGGDKVMKLKDETSVWMNERLHNQTGLVWFEEEKSNQVEKDSDLLITPLYVSADNIEDALWAKTQLESAVKSLPGLVKLDHDSELFAEHWVFQPDYQRLAEVGMSVRDLSEQTGFELAPQFLGRIPVAGDLIDVRLKLQNYDQMSPETLRGKLDHLQVQHPIHRGLIALSKLGEWTKEFSQTKIDKRNGIPSIELKAEFDQTKTNRQTVFASLESIAEKIQQQKPGIDIKTNETQESQDEEFLSYAIEIGLAVVLIYILVGLSTGSYLKPLFLIIGLLPIVGSAIIALFFHDRPISVLVFIGLISVIGISLNDGLIILFKIKEGSDGGIISRETILDAMGSKLRAVIITGTCAGIGLFPIAYSTADVNLFVRPIAFGAMWGLFGSVLQALLLLPSLFFLEADGQSWVRGLKSRMIQSMLRLQPKTRKLQIEAEKI